MPAPCMEVVKINPRPRVQAGTLALGLVDWHIGPIWNLEIATRDICDVHTRHCQGIYFRWDPENDKSNKNDNELIHVHVHET